MYNIVLYIELNKLTKSFILPFIIIISSSTSNSYIYFVVFCFYYCEPLSQLYAVLYKLDLHLEI